MGVKLKLLYINCILHDSFYLNLISNHLKTNLFPIHKQNMDFKM